MACLVRDFRVKDKSLLEDGVKIKELLGKLWEIALGGDFEACVFHAEDLSPCRLGMQINGIALQKVQSDPNLFQGRSIFYRAQGDYCRITIYSIYCRELKGAKILYEVNNCLKKYFGTLYRPE